LTGEEARVFFVIRRAGKSTTRKDKVYSKWREEGGRENPSRGRRRIRPALREGGGETILLSWAKGKKNEL